MEIGFDRLGLFEIASWTLPISLASQGVMEKLGFRYERDFEFAGLVHRLYRLSVGEWNVYRGVALSICSCGTRCKDDA